MEDDHSSTNDSFPGSMASRITRGSSASSRRSSEGSRISRRGSSTSTTSSVVNIDDLSLLSESFPARLWHRWIGLVRCCVVHCVYTVYTDLSTFCVLTCVAFCSCLTLCSLVRLIVSFSLPLSLFAFVLYLSRCLCSFFS